MAFLAQKLISASGGVQEATDGGHGRPHGTAAGQHPGVIRAERLAFPGH